MIRNTSVLAAGRADMEIVRNHLGEQERVPSRTLAQQEAIARIAWLARKHGLEPKVIVGAGITDGRCTRAVPHECDRQDGCACDRLIERFLKELDRAEVVRAPGVEAGGACPSAGAEEVSGRPLSKRGNRAGLLKQREGNT